MARKKKQVEIDDSSLDNNIYSRCIGRMKKFRDANSKTWRRNEFLLFGENPPSSALAALKPMTQGSAPLDTIAYAWGLVKSMETSIYVQNPEVALEAFDDQFRSFAQKLSDIAQYDLTTMDVKTLGNLMLVDNFISGYGAVIERIESNKYESKSGEQIITEQDFSAIRLLPKDTLFDPQSMRLDLSDTRYIATAWYPTVAALQADKEFDLPENIEEYPEASPMTRDETRTDKSVYSGTTYTETEKDPEYKTICVWEFWDKVEQEKYYVLDYGGKVIGEEEWPCRLRFRSRELFPLTLMAMHPQAHTFYPKPELDLIAPQLVEMNIIQAQMRKDLTTKFRKVVVPADLFTEDQLAHLTSTDKEWQVIRVNNEDITALVGQQNAASFDINRLMAVVDQPQMERDLVARYEMLKQDIGHIIGWGEGQRGGLVSTRSAREAMMINESKNQRLQKRFDAIADFYRLFVAKHILMLKKLLSVDRYAKVLPSDMGIAAQYFKYTDKDLGGEFMFDVYAGSSAPKTTESRKASELQFFQAVVPVLQAAGLPITPAFYRLADAFQWKGVDEVFGGQKEAMKQFAATMFAHEAGLATPQQLLESGANAIMKNLNPAELQQLKQVIAQQAQVKQLTGTGVGQPGAGASGPGGDQNPLATAAMTEG
jgi:hypothetical protein